jgi:hypothetical protein
MKAVKVFLLVLAIIFVVIQFIPSGIPENIPEDENSLSRSSMVPQPVLEQLRTSCYDCHSNQTNLPWYSKIAPFSWMLADHIIDGRASLNFSEWESYSRREKLGQLESISDVVESGEMPLKSYLRVHRYAKLDEEKIAVLNQWVEETSDKILE